MKALKIVFVATVLASLATPGWSHDDATLDKSSAPNGGQLRMAGMYHYELVVAPVSAESRLAPVTVYLTDHAGARIPSAGATGSVIVLSGTQKASVVLQPDGDNRMKGEGTYRSTIDMKAIVSIPVAGKPAEQARFTPLASRGAM